MLDFIPLIIKILQQPIKIFGLLFMDGIIIQVIGKISRKLLMVTLRMI